MQIVKHPLFVEKCWSFSLEKHQEYKQRINQILLVEKNKEKHEHTTEADKKCNVFAWRSDWNSHKNYPVLREIADDIGNHIVEIMKEEKIKFNLDYNFLNLASCWVNNYKKGDHAVPHRHFLYGFSAVYFTDIPENSSEFLFYNPIGLNLESELDENQPTLKLNMLEGSVIIFRGYLQHGVTEHMNNKERTTVALNYELASNEGRDGTTI